MRRRETDSKGEEKTGVEKGGESRLHRPFCDGRDGGGRAAYGGDLIVDGRISKGILG